MACVGMPSPISEYVPWIVDDNEHKRQRAGPYAQRQQFERLVGRKIDHSDLYARTDEDSDAGVVS